ncbi:2-C-methyl-D-erythritol 2,4-cyclodiphosphate synthase [Acidithiobacillus sp. 'AMD consortium']|uniref:2-C-methyl-D-erythritol 2,4-cyclodiphosphate synthase n=2 Tax=Acidithiobacillus ferridurans TaxID=1232575 RepID=A0A8X8KA02_ACIFI|nr:2-C-methyl-D-erythritol 2,4-cyclodiphosphate synthase [Acidithiobacillus ferridurans]QFG77578.1 2-C-methyl-D-erythritol 2,4-cyclodiphosphate synthase [Acidithiobacillus sp. 'AMD consortium']MBU2716817.1 2-C-methyl-D-erythritol 2,4-cyclodiphosphate synthase [Acidithiobacillus ferridurans]MBU2719224.1 2-C-methyl-D-erythritol 2,4-cyclodiphosphate synthase [Acidithiobacillus ferridurans]MBU2722347.1 2-C-methyl-D-erythritol 2,4-cyclodiphosphate synthase [Acidithiobacillus ferridurans]MBU2727621.
MQLRIGHGFDVHALVPGRALILGGVSVPYERGLAGHSDADVLLHSVCDALLGAAALGDIGHHFPDTDAHFEGADSRLLLRHCRQLVQGKGFTVGNVDATIVCQRPKLADHIPQMRAHIAADLAVDLDAVNIKATTTEQLGYTGRGEGIAAHAVVLIRHV